MIDYENFNGNIQELMKTRSGRQVIFHLLGLAGIYSNPKGPTNDETNYNLGRQSMGHEIIAMLDEADPQIYPRLLLESADYGRRTES